MMVKILIKMLMVSMYIPIDALMGSYGTAAYKGYVSAFLMIFCVSYNMNPPKMTSPPYVTTDCKPTATIELAGRNNVPRHAIHTPPRPMAKGPPHDRNLPSGAQAAVRDKAPTTPPVTAAALSTNGPPSNMRGAIRVPISAL